MNEQIVRDYLEGLGFFAIQPSKYQVAARKKTAGEEIDLLVVNPRAATLDMPEPGLWGSAELRAVGKALVSVRGWHTDRFTPSVLEKAPELLRFAEDDVLEQAQSFLGPGPVAKILCISDLPASKGLQQQVLGILRERGVDGVVLFRNILMELAADIDVKNNYEKSDVLQLLRILKNYDLLRNPQMELFANRRRSPKA